MNKSHKCISDNHVGVCDDCMVKVEELPVFIGILNHGTLEVIRLPTMYKGKSDVDVHDYMDSEYGHDVDWMIVNNFSNVSIPDYMNHDLVVGDLVIAKNEQEETGFYDKGENWIHAEKGDMGIVEYISHDGYPTVRFKKSGTATLLSINEIVIVKNISSLVGGLISEVD